MRQKNNAGYPEVISMEEYLTKRKKIKEDEQSKEKNRKIRINPAWMLEEIKML